MALNTKHGTNQPDVEWCCTVDRGSRAEADLVVILVKVNVHVRVCLIEILAACSLRRRTLSIRSNFDYCSERAYLTAKHTTVPCACDFSSVAAFEQTSSVVPKHNVKQVIFYNSVGKKMAMWASRFDTWKTCSCNSQSRDHTNGAKHFMLHTCKMLRGAAWYVSTQTVKLDLLNRYWGGNYSEVSAGM
jgi:hypothetical protein